MEEVAAFRAKIIEILTRAQDAKGNPKLTEKQVKDLANELRDDELAEGMMFNTPEEVAELLLESGLE